MSAIDAVLAVARDHMDKKWQKDENEIDSELEQQELKEKRAKDHVVKESGKGRFFDEKVDGDIPRKLYINSFGNNHTVMEQVKGGARAVSKPFSSREEAMRAKLTLETAKDAEYIEEPHLGLIPPRNKREAMDDNLEEEAKQTANRMGQKAYVVKDKTGRMLVLNEGQLKLAGKSKFQILSTHKPEVKSSIQKEQVKPQDLITQQFFRDVKKRGFDDCDANPSIGDSFAFDYSSVRSTDPDGRMRVAITNISKSTVNPYKGEEIPDYEKLGLDKNKIYNLYRDPEELAKAASTFNNLPLLKRHPKPEEGALTADTHNPDLVIGSTGTDASFEAPYLRNSLVFWSSKDGIKDVESNKKKELSSAYRYRADMTPGIWEDPQTGEKKSFDGIMRDICGNHVALVHEGRAGHDVVVGDSKAGLVAGHKRKRQVMGTMSKTAANTMLVLSSYLRPKLAQDTKIDLKPVVKDLTAKNFNERRSEIIREVRKLTKGKLANDASIGEIAEVLDLLEAHPETGEDAPVTDTQEAMMSEMTDVPGASLVSGQGSPGAGDRRRGARDRRARDTYDRKARDHFGKMNPAEELEEKEEMQGKDRARDGNSLEAFLKSKLNDEDFQQACNMMHGGGEDDATANDDEHAEGEEHLEDLGAAHADDDAETPQEHSDIERAREWHVGAGEEPGAGHPGKTEVHDRAAYDRKRAKDRKRAHDEPPPFKGMPKVGHGPMDKRAMDVAIKVAVDAAIDNQRQIRQAEKDVRPWVGELAMDSATCPADVYEAALKARGVNTKGMHHHAFLPILQNLPKPGQGNNGRGSAPRVAMDANSRVSFNEMFPDVARNMSRIGNL